MRPSPACLLTLTAVLLSAGPAAAQYSKAAGRSAPTTPFETEERGHDGRVYKRIVDQKVASDRWGNAQGNDNDLAVDGAFTGQTVAVLHLYTGFDFSLPKAALAEKGFSVYRWIGTPPTPAALELALAKSSQLWIISDADRRLDAEHLRVIRNFYEAGHGVYIWGDNEPYYGDANFIAEALFGTKMLGNLQGEQTVGMQERAGMAGLLPNHLLTTGLEHIYEGHTIATIQPNSTLEPLIYGSAGNLVTAFHDRDGKRAILDGGFTRLYMKWDTAGTARYVKNAAAWLVNAERFGDAVLSPALRISRIASEPAPAAVAPAPEAVAPAPTMRPAAAPRPFLATGLVGLALFAAVGGLLLLSIAPGIGRRD